MRITKLGGYLAVIAAIGLLISEMFDVVPLGPILWTVLSDVISSLSEYSSTYFISTS